jgi:hypothetical protein
MSWLSGHYCFLKSWAKGWISSELFMLLLSPFRYMLGELCKAGYDHSLSNLVLTNQTTTGTPQFTLVIYSTKTLPKVKFISKK